MNTVIRISHTLSKDSPGWPDCPRLSIEPVTRLAKGQGSDSSLVSIFNHFSTHIDAPAHFIPGARRLCDFSISDFIFERPLLVDIPEDWGGVVGIADLEPFIPDARNADILLIRSGGARMRREDPARYALESPSLDPDAARYLMDEAPGLRAIGVDWISIASPSHIEAAAPIHEFLLGKHHGRHVFIIEDMDLAPLEGELPIRVFAVPLFIDGVDSGPATVFAELARD